MVTSLNQIGDFLFLKIKTLRQVMLIDRQVILIDLNKNVNMKIM